MSRSMLVFGSWKRDEYAAPQAYLQNLNSILEQYSDDIIDRVTNPLTGIQRTSKFPPSIAEVVAACEQERHESTYAAQWNEAARKQLEERAEFERQAKAESPEYRRQVVERVLGKERAARVLDGINKHEISAEELAEHERILERYRQKALASKQISSETAVHDDRGDVDLSSADGKP
jgi:hypothetical protein